MTENIREHSLGLKGIWQVDYDPRPLLCEDIIIIRIIPSMGYGLRPEVDESLLDRFRIAPVREGPVEHWSVFVDLESLGFEQCMIPLVCLVDDPHDSLG